MTYDKTDVYVTGRQDLSPPIPGSSLAASTTARRACTSSASATTTPHSDAGRSRTRWAVVSSTRARVIATPIPTTIPPISPILRDTARDLIKE